MSLSCVFLGLTQNLCLGRPGWGPGVCISWVSVTSGPGTTLWAPGSRANRTASSSSHQKRAEEEGGSTEAGRRRHAAKGEGLAQTVRMSRSPQIYKKEGASWPSECPLCYPGFQAEHRAGLSTSSESGFEINERTTAGDITCRAGPSLPRRGHRVP